MRAHGRIQQTRPRQPPQQTFQLVTEEFPEIPGGTTHRQDTAPEPQPSSSHQTPNRVNNAENQQQIPKNTRNVNNARRKSNNQLNQNIGSNHQEKIQTLLSEARTNSNITATPQQHEVNPMRVVSNEVDTLKKELAKQMKGIIQFLVTFISLLPQDAQTKQKMTQAARQIFGEKVDHLDLFNHHRTKQEPTDPHLNNQTTVLVIDENLYPGTTTFAPVAQQLDINTQPQCNVSTHQQ